MTTTVQIVTEQDIEALVDNQLEWERAKNVLQYIDQNNWAKKYYEEISRQKNMLNAWWDQRMNVQ